MGDGDVVLIGYRAQFRGQPRNTFKLIFNTIHGATLQEMPPSAAAMGGGN